MYPTSGSRPPRNWVTLDPSVSMIRRACRRCAVDTSGPLGARPARIRIPPHTSGEAFDIPVAYRRAGKDRRRLACLDDLHGVVLRVVASPDYASPERTEVGATDRTWLRSRVLRG